MLATCLQVVLLVDPEDGSDMFLRNVGLISTQYTTALYPALRRRLFVCLLTWSTGFQPNVGFVVDIEAVSRVLSECLGNIFIRQPRKYPPSAHAQSFYLVPVTVDNNAGLFMFSPTFRVSVRSPGTEQPTQ
jgi:hypothetical protein